MIRNPRQRCLIWRLPVIGPLLLASVLVAAAVHSGKAFAATGDSWQAPNRSSDWRGDEVSSDGAARNRASQHSPFHRENFWSEDPGEALLDHEIRQASRALVGIGQDPAFPPHVVVVLDDRGSSLAEVPLSFYVMGLTSLALALAGLAVIIYNRPPLGELRGRDETNGARRMAVRCVAVLFVLNLADLGFTAFLAPCQEFVELNPLGDLLRDSLPMLVALKLGVVGGCAALLLRFWRYKIVQFASWTAATVYTGMAIWWVAYFRAALS